jgi:hypothetical protein
MIKLALCVVLIIALVAIILAACAMQGRIWKRCLKCRRYFSNTGDISEEEEASFPPTVHDGVCDDCVKDAEFRA